MISYYSTNRCSRLVGFQEALICGQAPDKGLYLPKPIPKINLSELKKMKKMSYSEIAFLVLNKFLAQEIPEKELKEITKKVYTWSIPIEKVTDKIYILRLDQGPTASFKDFAAQMMARLMEHFLKKEKKKLTILTATSGDTGSAVASAFYNLKNIRVIILFPINEVTIMQRKQMTTLGGNIFTLAIKGKFDNCQALVKKAFSDSELKSLDLSSANSINIGRLLPQTIYYFYAYSRIAEIPQKVIFSVPSGNFGNLVGGILAKKMGLPVYKFIAAVNENDEFPQFLKSCHYQPIKPSKNCLSNAMNVGHPSNLARLIDLYAGKMNEKGKILKMPKMATLKKDIFSVSLSNKETIQTIRNVYKKYKIILEPHGAVGFRGLGKFLLKEKPNLPVISLETAHPGKFPETVQKILNLKISPPQKFFLLKSKKEKFTKLPADYQKFKKYLLDSVR